MNDGGPQGGRQDSREFRKGIMITAVPIVLASLVSTAGAVAPGFYWAWAVAGGLILVGLVAAIVVKGMGRQQLGTGLLAGVGIGVLALGVSCFANLSMFERE